MKDLMRSNVATFALVGKAITAGDWITMGDGFIQFSQNARRP